MTVFMRNYLTTEEQCFFRLSEFLQINEAFELVELAVYL
jgi:hypothetical protein